MQKIRLDRTQKGGKSFFIIVTDSRNAIRSGNRTDKVGYYNSVKNTNNLAEKVVIDMDKYNKYISLGAQPTDAVLKLVKAIEKNANK